MICPYMFVNTCACTYMMYEPLIEIWSKIQDFKRKELKKRKLKYFGHMD